MKHKKKEIKHCELCKNEIIGKNYGLYCQKCYLYLKRHPEGIYQLPPKKEIKYALNGDPICHICGQAHRKLGNHINQTHKMSQNEYREMFLLYHNTKLSNVEYREVMAKHNKDNQDIVVRENLIKKGQNTRLTSDYNTIGRKYQYKVKESTIK